MYAADILPKTPQRVRQGTVSMSATGRMVIAPVPPMQTVSVAFKMDHSRCDHEKTSKARATCRRARASDNVVS